MRLVPVCRFCGLSFVFVSVLQLSPFLSVAVAQTQAATSTPTQSASAPRDASAVAILTQSLNAMGGAAAWSAVQTADTQGTFTQGGSISTFSFDWIDDWSNGFRSNREITDQNGHHYTLLRPDNGGTSADAANSQATPSSNQIATDHIQALLNIDLAKQRNRIGVEPTIAVLGHLPALTLKMLLDDNTYSLEVVPPPPSSTETLHIDATTGLSCVRSTHIGHESTRFTICFSTATSLPSFAVEDLQNLSGGRLVSAAKITYSSFSSQEKLIRPLVIQMSMFGQNAATYTLSSVAWNSDLSSVSFQGGK